ncbi:MAG: arabinosyltransferase domain-containing protein [Pseudonocardiaceae bacterium]
MAPLRWWRPRVIDAVVVAGLAMWAVIGPINIDDGYIASILRTRDTNDYIGNLHRWLNAPEAPFGWFYELYYLWSEISAAPLWMRIPSTALGVVCWLLLSRALLPRLGTFAARPATAWVAAAVFAAWWLPFNLGLRPEPWIAVAGLITLLAVERAVVTRRLLPVLLGLVVAAAATAITPTGIITCTPFLAGLVPLLRALRQRSELTGLPLLVLLVAAPSSALLLGFGDQTLASVVEATRVRTLIGGGLPWYQEIERYWNLLTPGSVEGPLQRRVPVLLTLLGLAGLAWSLGRHRVAGIARGPVTRVSLTLVLSLAAMIFTPTKWTYHFGALAGVGSAVLVAALYAWSRRTLQVQQCPARSLAAAAVGTATLAVTAGVALAGFNHWHYVSNYGAPWSTLAPQLGGVSISTIVLAGGMLLAAVAGGTAAWALAGGGLPASIRLLPSPGLLALVLVVGTVSLQFGTFARAGTGARGGYPMAADSVAAGSSCGLADHLRVETDPLAGLLAVSKADGAAMDGFVPISEGPVGDSRLEMAGAALPGWAAPTQVGDPSRGNTPWYHLDGRARHGAAPVVVTISGELAPGSTLAAEFGRSGSAIDSASGGAMDAVVPLATVPLTDQHGAPAARDIRITVPDVPGANLVRLSVTANWDPATVPLAFSQPRSPRTKPMNAVVPPGTEAVVDWPVAFLYPCLEIAGTPGGTGPRAALASQHTLR